MQIAEHVEFKFEGGKIKLELDAKAALLKPIEDFEAKVKSGEIDPIKATDLDQVALLKAIEFLKSELVK